MPDRLVQERKSEPHIPVFDMSRRQNVTSSRGGLAYHHHTRPADKTLELYRRRYATASEAGIGDT